MVLLHQAVKEDKGVKDDVDAKDEEMDAGVRF
jgi:hypothetical protein